MAYSSDFNNNNKSVFSSHIDNIQNYIDDDSLTLDIAEDLSEAIEKEYKIPDYL